MVEDINNFDDVYDGIDIALEDGMAAVHELTLAKVLSNWESGQDAMGNAWEPLKQETILKKGHDRILIDSGELKADVAAQSYFDEETLTSVIQTDKVYGPVHEFGVPERGIPARPFLGPAGAYAASLLPEQLEERLNLEIRYAEVR